MSEKIITEYIKFTITAILEESKYELSSGFLSSNEIVDYYASKNSKTKQKVPQFEGKAKKIVRSPKKCATKLMTIIWDLISKNGAKSKWSTILSKFAKVKVPSSPYFSKLSDELALESSNAEIRKSFIGFLYKFCHWEAQGVVFHVAPLSFNAMLLHIDEVTKDYHSDVVKCLKKRMDAIEAEKVIEKTRKLEAQKKAALDHSIEDIDSNANDSKAEKKEINVEHNSDDDWNSESI